MISFFRNNRRQGIKGNKTIQYLKYAIGEIFLVVIGILIALQVNNWNAMNRDKTAEIEYYCQLLEDLELDRKNIDDLSIAADLRISLGKKLMVELHSMKKDKGYIINTYLEVYRSNAFIPSKATITDITSSGKLKLLQNKALKTDLLRYYADLDNIIQILESNRDELQRENYNYENILIYGWQEINSIKRKLDSEILELLPNENWQLNSSHEYFKQFEEALFMAITMSDREQELYNIILGKMNPIYEQLIKSCDR